MWLQIENTLTGGFCLIHFGEFTSISYTTPKYFLHCYVVLLFISVMFLTQRGRARITAQLQGWSAITPLGKDPIEDPSQGFQTAAEVTSVNGSSCSSSCNIKKIRYCVAISLWASIRGCWSSYSLNPTAIPNCTRIVCRNMSTIEPLTELNGMCRQLCCKRFVEEREHRPWSERYCDLFPISCHELVSSRKLRCLLEDLAPYRSCPNYIASTVCINSSSFSTTPGRAIKILDGALLSRLYERGGENFPI